MAGPRRHRLSEGCREALGVDAEPSEREQQLHNRRVAASELRVQRAEGFAILLRAAVHEGRRPVMLIFLLLARRRVDVQARGPDRRHYDMGFLW